MRTEGAAGYGDLGIREGSARRRRVGREQESTALESMSEALWSAPALSDDGDRARSECAHAVLRAPHRHRWRTRDSNKQLSGVVLARLSS